MQDLNWDDMSGGRIVRVDNDSVNLIIVAGDSFLDAASPAYIEILVYP